MVTGATGCSWYPLTVRMGAVTVVSTVRATSTAFSSGGNSEIVVAIGVSGCSWSAWTGDTGVVAMIWTRGATSTSTDSGVDDLLEPAVKILETEVSLLLSRVIYSSESA